MTNINFSTFLLNRVVFTLFGIDVYWYGLIIAFSIGLAFGLSFILVKKRGLPLDLPIDLFLAIIPTGIIGARLFSVLFSGAGIETFFQFRNGGMSIIGAVIGGAIGLTILCLIKKYNFLKIADVIVPVLILAQAIGRWGNFANGEVYGIVVTDVNLQFFPFAVNINGVWHLALFFFEFVLDLIGAIILFITYFKSKKPGDATGIYLLYYGLIRLILESLRDSEFILMLWGAPISQIVSALFLLIGLHILIFVNYGGKNNARIK